MASEGSGRRERDTGLAALLSQISSLVAVPQHDKQRLDELVGRVVSIGTRQGFSDQQATQVAQLVLRSVTPSGRPLGSRIGVKLLRSIHPARNEQFGENLALTVLGALGPAEDAIIDVSNHPGLDTDMDAGESGDEDVLHRKRSKIAVGVQAAALRLLLLLLLCPPPAVMDADESPASAHLPMHFLSKRARRSLDRCYGLMFHFLDYQTLRPHLCHLLSLITRRKHVRHHRIAKLLFLRSTATQDPYVGALLSTYANYLPNLLYADLPGSSGAGVQARSDSHPGGIRYPDTNWLLSVHAIWSNSEQESAEEESESTSMDSNGLRPRKRRRKEKPSSGQQIGIDVVVPLASLARSLLPPPTVLSLQPKSLLVTEIMSCKGLGYVFDRLQFPSHLASALTHTMTAIAVLAEDSRKALDDRIARISYWATSAIGEEMSLPASKLVQAQELPPRSRSSHQRSASLLHVLAGLVQRMGMCNAALQQWTSRLLQPVAWTTLIDEEKLGVLGLVEMCMPGNWAETSRQVVEPLSLLIKSSSAADASHLVHTLRRLVERWVLGRDWAAMALALESGSKDVYLGHHRLSPTVDYIETISQTVTTAVEQSSLLLVQWPLSLEALDAALSLCERIFSAPFIGLHPFQLPPRYPLYLFSTSQHGTLVSLSRLFTIIKQVRDLHVEMEWSDLTAEDSFSAVELPERMRQLRKSFYCDESRDAFNACSIFLIDLVWRSNGYGSVRSGSLDTGIPVDFFVQLGNRCSLRGDELERVGSISHSAGLSPLMEAHANEIAIAARCELVLRGPITSHVLEQARLQGFPAISYRKLRDSHIDWLGDRGARGIKDFLHVTVSRLLEGQAGHDHTRDHSNATTTFA